MQKGRKSIAIAEPYRREIDGVVFVISSFGNPNTTVSGEDMIFDMLKSKILNENPNITEVKKYFQE